MSTPARGRIVWTVLPDPQGRNPKRRPAVIVTPTGNIHEGGDLVVVAITSRVDAAPAEDQVELPWHRDGHPRTGLRERSVAICTWFARIPTSAIDGYGGQVPTPQMLRILARLDALSAAEAPPAVPGQNPAPASGEQTVVSTPDSTDAPQDARDEG